MDRPNLHTCTRPEMIEYVVFLEGLLDLPDPSADHIGPWVRRVDSDTSKKAAYDIFPESGSQRLRVLVEIWNAGRKGVTRDELSVRLRLPSNSICPRVWELKHGGWVMEDVRAVRITRAGCEAHPVILTKAAMYTIKNRSVLMRQNGHGPMKLHEVPVGGPQ
jgi:hypothetical protein